MILCISHPKLNSPLLLSSHSHTSSPYHQVLAFNRSVVVIELLHFFMIHYHLASTACISSQQRPAADIVLVEYVPPSSTFYILVAFHITPATCCRLASLVSQLASSLSTFLLLISIRLAASSNLLTTTKYLTNHPTNLQYHHALKPLMGIEVPARL